jgi:hypothetical protein
LSAKNHILDSCVISKGTVYKNGKAVFSHEDGDASAFLDSAYIFTDARYPKFYKMDNLSKLGFLASEILLKDNEQLTSYPADEVGIVLSNANASLDTDIKYYKTVSEFASPALFVYTLPNIVIGEICIRNGFKGENAFFISEQFNAPFIVEYVDNLINNNILQCCICGWIELLKESYKAALFLVGQKAVLPSGSLPFDVNQIVHIYQSDNG